jgi:cytochrome c553
VREASRPRAARRSTRAALLAVLFGALANAGAADTGAIAEKAKLCISCHGPDGNSKDPAIPTIAGQPKQFITTQLVMFREKNRKNDAMLQFVENLSNAEINDFGTYFSAQAMRSAGAPLAPERAAEAQKLVTQFNCVQCHGRDLKGLQHIPRLAGQQPQYLRTQLLGFKAMTRFDMDGNMTSAAQALQPGHIDLIAEYLSGLQ